MTIVDALTTAKLPRRIVPPRAIVVHGTGSTTLDGPKGVLALYKVGPLCPHFVIGADGTVYRIADPATQEAWHCAMHPREAEMFSHGFDHWSQFTSQEHVPVPAPKDGRYEFWRQKWVTKNLQSPIQFVTSDRPNFYSVGIELLSLDKQTPVGFTVAQYQGCAELIALLAKQFSIPIDEEHIFSHSEVNPLARVNDPLHGLNYDPHRHFDWPSLFEMIGEHQ